MANEDQPLDPFANYSPEQYRAVVDRLQANAARSQSQVLTYQLDVGKWMLATLLVLNAGGLVAVANSGAQASKLFAATGVPLTIGVVAALGSGFFGWVNACFVGILYGEFLDPFMADHTSRFPKPFTGWKRWAAPFTTALSLAAGFVSVGAFCWAMIAARSALNT